MNSEVVVPEKQLAPYQEAIQNAEERFRKVSQHLSYDKESIFAMQQLVKSDYSIKIANQNPKSIILALHNLASTGLTLNPAHGYAYLVPRDGSIMLDISYKGLIKIATDTGAVSWARADVVYSSDTFTYHGPAGAPTHRNDDPFRKDKGDIVGVYCIAKTSQGDILTEIMDREEMEKIRSKSMAFQKEGGGPWKEWFNQMAKKAVIKRASKTWPYTEQSSRLMEAIEIANTSEGGYDLETGSIPAARIEDTRKQRCDEAYEQYFPSVDLIKECIGRWDLTADENELWTVAETWYGLPQAAQMDLYLAPSHGGIFTTHERDVIKSKLPKQEAS